MSDNDALGIPVDITNISGFSYSAAPADEDLGIAWSRADADRLQTPLCGRCGLHSVGFATIDDQRYCHGDPPPYGDGDSPSCFELAQWSGGGASLEWIGDLL